MVKEVPIKIGGEEYVLRRSWKAMASVEKRLGGGFDTAKLASLSALIGFLQCLLRTKSGKELNDQQMETLSERMDLAEVNSLQTAIATLMEGVRPIEAAADDAASGG